MLGNGVFSILPYIHLCGSIPFITSIIHQLKCCVFNKKDQEWRYFCQQSRFTILGLHAEDHKERLGLYLSKSEGANECSTYSQICRIVTDILIACIDGRKSFLRQLLRYVRRQKFIHWRMRPTSKQASIYHDISGLIHDSGYLIARWCRTSRLNLLIFN